MIFVHSLNSIVKVLCSLNEILLSVYQLKKSVHLSVLSKDCSVQLTNNSDRRIYEYPKLLH